MGLGDRFKGLRKVSEHSVKTTPRATEADDDARLAALEAMKAQGSLTDREYRSARQRIIEGKD